MARVPKRPVLKTRGATHGELMTGLSRLTRRQWLIVIHDLLATAAALLCTLFIRFETRSSPSGCDGFRRC